MTSVQPTISVIRRRNQVNKVGQVDVTRIIQETGPANDCEKCIPVQQMKGEEKQEEGQFRGKH